jgi:serine protease Do
MSRIRAFLVLGWALAIAEANAPHSFADEKNRREQAVRNDRQSLSGDERWTYNDLDSGFELAKKTGKPLLVVLRCVPCKACTGIDESVVRAKDLQGLLDEFVCVRVINSNALDLSRFQFDYDLSFSTLVFNADGTLYGRFGSWQHQLDELDVSTAGFKACLERALEVHRAYPSNQDSLKPKQGGPTPFAVPVEIPGLAGKYERELKWESDNVTQSCVHCHQIGHAFRAWHRNRGERIPDELIYPMPDPITLGLQIDNRTTGLVRRVRALSLAERAGFQKRDDVVAIDGAPIFSVADMAWALHRAPDQGSMRWTVLSGGQRQDLTLDLPFGWRRESDISERVGTWQMRAMALGGMVLKTATPSQRTAWKLSQEDLGLLVHAVGEFGDHAAAKNAGFRKGDVVLSIEGIEQPIDESKLIGQILREHPGKGSLPVVVLREGKRLLLQLPIQ